MQNPIVFIQSPRKRQQFILFLTAFAVLLPFFANVLCLVPLMIYFIWHQRRSLGTLIQEQGWYGIFCFYTAIVSAINVNIMGELLAMAFLFFGLYFKVYERKITADTYWRILKCWVLGSIVLAGISLSEYLWYIYRHGHDLLYILKVSVLGTRAEATFFNANYYGLFCVFMIMTAIYLIMRTSSNRWRYLYAGSILANLLAIFLTASRFFYPTIIVAGLFFLYMINKRWAFVVAWGTLAVAVIIILFPELMPRSDSLDGSFTGRVHIWQTGFKIFASSPLTGRGPMSYLNFYYLFDDKVNIHSHNIVVDFLANFGLIGVALAGLIIQPYIKQVRSLYQDPTTRIEFGFIMSLVLVVLFHGIMDVALLWIQTAFVFFTLVLCPPDILKQIAKRTDLH